MGIEKTLDRGVLNSGSLDMKPWLIEAWSNGLQGHLLGSYRIKYGEKVKIASRTSSSTGICLNRRKSPGFIHTPIITPF